MSKFLTVKEAATLIGKSPSAVRRIIYPILKDDNNPDRKHIEPSVEKALELLKKTNGDEYKRYNDLLPHYANVREHQKQSEKAGQIKAR